MTQRQLLPKKQVGTPSNANQVVNLDKGAGQLNWFDLETKCQKLVYDIMYPTVERQRTDREIIDKLDNTITENIFKRLNEIEIFCRLKKNSEDSAPTVFDLLETQIRTKDEDNRENFAQLSNKLDSLAAADEISEFKIKKCFELQQSQQLKIEILDAGLITAQERLFSSAKANIDYLTGRMDKLQSDLKEATELGRKLESTLLEHSDMISDHTALLGLESTKTQSM